MHHRVRARKVEPDAAGLKADEKNGDGRVALKLLDDLGAVPGRTIEITEGDLLRGQFLAQQGEHGGELAENQNPMPSIERFLEQFQEKLRFTGMGAAAALPSLSRRGSQQIWRNRSNAVKT